MGHAPQGNENLEVRRPEVGFHGVQVVEEAREEAEEGLLLKLGTLLLMRMGEHKDDDGQDLGQILDLNMVLSSRSHCVTVVFDEQRDESRERVDGLEDVVRVSRRCLLPVALHARLGTNSEERKLLVAVQYALLLQLLDEGDEGLLRRCRPLEDLHPFEEPRCEFTLIWTTAVLSRKGLRCTGAVYVVYKTPATARL